MEKNVLKVEVLGSELSIRSEESPQHLRDVVNAFNLRVDEVKHALNLSDPLKIAILAGFNLASELVKHLQAVENKARLSEQQSAEIDKITDNLIQRIDRCLIEG